MKKIIVLICLLIISLLNITNLGIAQSESIIIVNGLPIKKVMSDIEGTESVNLNETEKFSYRLLITKKDNKYLWASRENKELIFSKSGIFYNFIETNGAGYIRVAKTGDKYLYMEHLTLGFKNITYWGIVEEFNFK